MSKEFVHSLESLSAAEKNSIARWFCNLVQPLERLRNFDEVQVMFVALIVALNREDHARKVLKAFIARAKKQKLLTPVKNPRNTPFDCDVTDLEEHFKQDEDVYDLCGEWKCVDDFSSNMCRVLFSGKKSCMTELAYCILLDEENPKRKTYTIPADTSVDDLPVSDAVFKRAGFLQAALNLSEDECKVLSAAYFTHTVKELYEMCQAIHNHTDESRISLYARCLDMPVKTVKALFRNDRHLVSFGLLEKDGDMESDAIDTIFTGDMQAFFCDLLKGDTGKESYALDSFSVSDQESELAVRLLKNPGSANILLYGAPGAGKTEYARALARKCGYEPVMYKNDIEVSEKEDKTALRRLNCYLSLDNGNTVVIVDEAERILETQMDFFSFFGGGTAGSGNKGTVNTMLENSVNKVIWIVNYTRGLDESTLRRFTYSICFPEMSRSMLQSIADSKLRPLGLSEDLRNRLVDLAGKYHVTGASVDNMVKTVRGMDVAVSGPERVISDVKRVLQANEQLLHGKKVMRDTVRDTYDLSVLNTTVEPEHIVKMAKRAMQVQDEMGDDRKDCGLRMLFYGVSGTGKTELARYIADRLGKKITLKRVSDIMSKWVGESEQNVANAFAEASASGNILLFDEADSFFVDRNSATHSWERTLVNEFLTQMEEFNGILICTTNLRKIMDSAMQRRFHVMTEFKALKPAAVEKLAEKYWPDLDFSATAVRKTGERLIRYDSVTPVTLVLLPENCGLWNRKTFLLSMCFLSCARCRKKSRVTQKGLVSDD